MLPRDPRLIDVCWPDWDRSLPPADGLVVFVAGTDAPSAWADEVLHCGKDGFVLWLAAGARPAPVIASVLTRRGVRAVALAPAGVDPGHVQAALRLARRLGDDAGPGRPSPVRVTSPTLPEGLGDELVPVAQLVTLHTPAGFKADTVFWVLLPAGEASHPSRYQRPGLAKDAQRCPRPIVARTATRALLADLLAQAAHLLTGRPAPVPIEVARIPADPPEGDAIGHLRQPTRRLVNAISGHASQIHRVPRGGQT